MQRREFFSSNKNHYVFPRSGLRVFRVSQRKPSIALASQQRSASLKTHYNGGPLRRERDRVRAVNT